MRSLARLMVGAGIAVSLAAISPFSPDDYDTPSTQEFDAFLKQQGNAVLYADFLQFLEDQHVLGVVPPDQLLRQGTDWQKLGEPAFAMPPRSQWKNIVPVLRLIREEIIPATGPVEVVSGFRTARYNRRAEGARTSKHLLFNAVDVVPIRPVSKDWLHETMRVMWEANGRLRNWGLGLYRDVRFHVDTGRYRRW